MHALIDYLRGCPTDFDHSEGLCYNVKERFKCDKAVSKLFDHAMCAVTHNHREHYIPGYRIFVIRHPSVSACDAYHDASEDCTMYEGEYGRRRIELANLIADELEKQLCKS